MKALSKKLTYFATGVLACVLMANQASALPNILNVFRKPKTSTENVLVTVKNEIGELTAVNQDTSYYLVVFGYEGRFNPANQSHTFAAYVQATPDGQQVWSSISWLPADFVNTRSICIFKNILGAIKDEIRGNNCEPVVGRNYSVSQTLQMAQGTRKTLGIWGPYRITREMYSRGIERVVALNNGQTKYLADDRKTRPTGEAINCMHAVGDLFDQGPGKGGFLNLGYGIWGIDGTKHVLNFLSNLGQDYVLDPIRIHQFRRIKNY